MAPSRPAPQLRKTLPDTPEGAAGLTFVLRSLTVEGATVYPQDILLETVSGKIGQSISVADLFEIAAAMTTRYRNDGYLLSSVIVPPQKIDSGAVTFRAVEGFVDRVVVEGVGSRQKSILHAYLDKLIGQRPLTRSKLERYLLLVDDLPGVQLASFLQPSPQNGGAALLTVKARVDQYNLWARADNRGSDYVGPYQAEVGGIWNGPAAIDQSLSARAIGTPLQVDELKYVGLSFSQEIDSEGTAIVISGSGMVSQPGKELIALDLESRSLGLDFLLRFKPIRSREMNMLVSIGGSVNESETTALGFPLSEDRSRSLSIGSEFQLADRFGGATSVTASVSKGLELLGATPSGDPLLSRSDAEQDAVWFDVTLSRLQNLAALARGFSLQASITGQYSLDPLSASREFAVGGRSNASGFDSSEISGDHGVSGRLELRYSTALPVIEDVVPGGYLRGTGVQIFAFGDGGAVWQVDGDITGQQNGKIASAGFGARFNLGPSLSGSVEVAKPFVKDVGSRGDRDPRVFFELTARF
jgi:hemolysin activation/secretion protein